MAKVRCLKLMNSYHPQYVDSIPLEVLATFLTDDYITFSGSFKKWVFSDDTGTGGNVTFLDKKGNDIVLTLDSVVFGIDIPFIASQQKFLAILNTWEKLYHEGWQEIIITQDDSGVHLVGKNNE